MAFNKCTTQPNLGSNQNPSRPAPTKSTDSIEEGVRIARDLAALSDNLDPEQLKEFVLQRGYVAELAKQVRINQGAVFGRIPVMRNMMEWLYDPQAPTSLKNFFNVSKKRGGNIIDALPLFADNFAMDSSRLNLTRQITQVSRAADQLLRRVGIDNKSKRDIIFIRTLEEGTKVFGENLRGKGRMVDEYLTRHRATYDDWMAKQGIDAATKQQLIQLAEGYIAANDVARRVATEAGLAVGKTEGIGFINRVMSPETRRVMRETKLTELEAAYENIGVPGAGGTLNSRRTFDFIVEDQLALADALGIKLPDGGTFAQRRAAIERQAQKVLDFKEKLRTADPRRQVKLDQAIASADNYKQKLESGTPGYSQFGYEKKLQVVERLRSEVNKPDPRYNRPTFERMQRKLDDMEYELLQDMQQPLVELATVIDDEGRFLNTVVGTAEEVELGKKRLTTADLDRLVDQGIMHKVPMPSVRVMEYMIDRYELPFQNLTEVMVTDPIQAHRLYVENLHQGLRNSNMTQNVIRGAIEEGWGVSSTAVKANPDQYPGWVSLGEVLRSKKLEPRELGITDTRQLNQLFVHPDVGNQYIASLDMSRNAGAMNAYTQIVHNLSKRALLTQAGFITKNLYGAMVSGWQAGGSMHTYVQSISQMVRVAISGGGLGSLDNTVRKYGGLTEQELYLEAVANGLIDGRNVLGEKKAIGSNTRGLANRLRYITAQLKYGRPDRASVRLADMVADISDDVLAPFLFVTTMLEDASKFNALKTITDNSSTAKFASIFTGSNFNGNTTQDALRHVQSYFIDFDDSNKVDGFIRSTLFPFWMYTSRNLPLQVRYATRNPGRFMAYYRLQSLMNEQARAEGDDFPEDGQDPWAADGMPLYFRLGDQWMSLARETYDPMLETISLLGEGFSDSSTQQSVQRALGDKTTGREIFDYFLGQAYADIKTFAAAITEEDPFTGTPLREADSLLGMPVPQIFGLPAGLTRYAIENNLPFIRQLNRANPGGWFGVRELRGVQGQIIRESRRAFFGLGAERYDRDVLIAGEDHEVPGLLKAARLLGAPVREVDVVSNVQRAQEFYDRSSRRFNTAVRKAEDQLRLATTPEEQEAAWSELVLQQAMQQQTQILSQATSLWLSQRGQPGGRQRRDLTNAARSLEADAQRRGIEIN